MVCSGFEPGAAGWWALTNPQSYDGPNYSILKESIVVRHLKSCDRSECLISKKNHFDPC